MPSALDMGLFSQPEWSDSSDSTEPRPLPQLGYFVPVRCRCERTSHHVCRRSRSCETRTVSTDTKLCSCTRKMRRSCMQCIDSRNAIHSTHLPYKKHSLAESVSTSAKQCVPMNNMIDGSQTYHTATSVAHLWWKSTLILRNRIRISPVSAVRVTMLLQQHIPPVLGGGIAHADATATAQQHHGDVRGARRRRCEYIL
ncbi:hypothetical protein SFRURICE_008431 [Spodoptera frugiperda]|nr:hypothetical protein SFRURICE_008431 [Spodoptera frugiperda]